MKYYLYLIVLPFTLITTGFVNAGEKVKHSLKVPATGSLFIKSPRGQITIEGWDRSEIQLSGELDDSAEHLIFKNSDDNTLIKIMMKGKSHWGDSTMLKVFMPKSLELHFKGIDTSYHINNLLAEVKGKTITGDITLDNVHSEIELSTVSGKVELENSSGQAEIESVSGDIVFSGKFEETEIQSMAGSIQVQIDNIQNLHVQSMSGDISVKGDLDRDAEVELSSVSGAIRYKATTKLNATCDIASNFGGIIKNMLTDDRPEKNGLIQKKLSFVSGDGSANLTMHTVSGSVFIDK